MQWLLLLQVTKITNPLGNFLLTRQASALMMLSVSACLLQRPLACAGAVQLLQTGRLPADHWDWAMGAGFSFTPEEDCSSEGEDQPKDPPKDPPMPADAPAAASSAQGAGGGEHQPEDPPMPDGVPAGATAGAASDHRLGGREQGRAAGPADGSGGGSGGGTGGAPAAVGGSDGVANGGEEACGDGELGPVHGVDLEHGFRLASADGQATPFTNYVRGCGTEPHSAEPSPSHRTALRPPVADHV